jgi:DNA-binding HxlR family transcriptional regulator
VLDRAENESTGTRVRPRARRTWTPIVRALTATGDRWTLLIALALEPGRMRVAQLHRQLPGVSTGVLERHVQRMVALGLITRTRFKEMPPRVELELTDAGRELLPLAGALARWGMRHVWSGPRAGEQVNLDALLRLLPVLLAEQAGLRDGSVESVVANADPPVRRVCRIQHGRPQLDHHIAHTVASDRSSAGIEGDRAAWIAALGPARDYRRLRFTGDELLARGMLDALPR